MADFDLRTLIASGINSLRDEIHEYATEKGFWPDQQNIPEKIALIHSEISEALEAYRRNVDKPDEHVPQFTNYTVELADAVIRILDLAGRDKLPIGEAIIAKLAYNKTRPHKHGKKF